MIICEIQIPNGGKLSLELDYGKHIPMTPQRLADIADLMIRLEKIVNICATKIQKRQEWADMPTDALQKRARAVTL